MMIKPTSTFSNCVQCHISWGYRKIIVPTTHMSLQSKWEDKTYPRIDISQKYRYMTELINHRISYSFVLGIANAWFSASPISQLIMYCPVTLFSFPTYLTYRWTVTLSLTVIKLLRYAFNFNSENIFVAGNVVSQKILPLNQKKLSSNLCYSTNKTSLSLYKWCLLTTPKSWSGDLYFEWKRDKERARERGSERKGILKHVPCSQHGTQNWAQIHELWNCDLTQESNA